MTESRTDQVFLSYASEDINAIRKVYKGLKKRGLIVWFDKEDMGPGKWEPQLEDAIHQSKYFIICISEIAIKKMKEKTGVQRNEIRFAYNIAMNLPEDKFTIVPVRIEDCDHGDHRLTSFQQYDLYDDFETGLDKIAVDLGGKSFSDAKAIDERTEDEKMAARLMGKAATAYYAGDYNLTIAVLDTIIALQPDDALIWSNKGTSLHRLGRYKEALAAYEKAIELQPDYAEAWSNKGAALGGLGRNEEELKACEKAIELNPDYAEVWFNKGVALVHLGRIEEALEARKKALELKPDL